MRDKKPSLPIKRTTMAYAKKAIAKDTKDMNTRKAKNSKFTTETPSYISYAFSFIRSPITRATHTPDALA